MKSTVKDAVRPIYRLSRQAVVRSTAGRRALPDFLIVGTMKGGTTSLYACLTESPDIVRARTKEPRYFADCYDQGTRWYRSHFPLASQVAGKITGEASPSYLLHPHAPSRAYALVPHAKIIILLREPAARARSHYEHNRLRGRELLSFEQALHIENERLRNLDFDQFKGAAYLYSYRMRGYYANQVARWLNCFGREQVLIIQSERLFRDPVGETARVCRWLEVRSPASTRVPIAPYNSGLYDRRDTATLRSLRQDYESPNEELFELVGERFDWLS